MIAQAQKEYEPQPPVGQTSFGSSIDPRRNQSDAYRRSTTDGDPFLFWFSAASPPANALSHPAGQPSIRTRLTGFPPGRARTTRPPNARDDPGPAAVFGSPLEAPALHARPSLLYTDRPAQSGSRPSLKQQRQYEEQMSPATAVHFVVIYTSTPPLNRTTRNPYLHQTPPNYTRRVSATVWSQNQTTNLLFLLLLLLLFGRGGSTTSSTAAGDSNSSSPSTRGNL